MVPTAEHVVDLVELYLVESEGAGWRSQHALEAVRAHGLVQVASGGSGPRETRASRQSVALLAERSRAGRIAETMLSVLESIDPKLRRALELRALGGTCEHIGLRLGVTRQKASVLLDRAVTAGQTYLLCR